MQKFNDRVIFKEKFQYFVGPPLAFITALRRPGIESTKAIRVSRRIEFQASCVAIQSSVLVLNRFLSSYCFTICHKFSLGDKSGMHGGVQNKLTPKKRKKSDNRTLRPNGRRRIGPRIS